MTKVLESARLAQEQILKEREALLAKARVDVEKDWDKRLAVSEKETAARNAFVKEQNEVRQRVEADRERERIASRPKESVQDRPSRKVENVKTRIRKPNVRVKKEPELVKAHEIGSIKPPKQRKTFKAKLPKYLRNGQRKGSILSINLNGRG